jgi:2-polyprenyl-3-methyl-5-hydroxy-6-metoxy-1,4-benzoquinol methylase
LEKNKKASCSVLGGVLNNELMKTILAIFLMLILISCESASNDQKAAPVKVKSANQYMHESNFEELINRFESEDREEWQEPIKVLRKLGDIRGKRIVEIGAGTGYFSFRLSKSGAKVEALDVDDRFIKYLEQRKKEENDSLLKVRKILIDDPELDSNSIDIVVIVNTYHHIEERVQYFKKILAALKEPEAKLVVVDFKKEPSPHGPPQEMRLSAIEVSQELKQAGFSKIIIDEYTLKEQYILIARKPISLNK